MAVRKGVLVMDVDPDSPAGGVGICAGDRVLAVNGRPVEDFLDFQFRWEPLEPNVLLILRPTGEEWEAEFELDEDEPLGVEWEPIHPRVCRNHCVFCFIDQLPRGVRPTLRIKDEDYRHSFLFGNFITLGNLTRADLKRILEQRISPLYVSVHATDPEVRAGMLRFSRADRFFENFKALVEGGIVLHTQIVLCPGINDGEILLRTVEDLAQNHPGVESVGIVPVGLTAHREKLHPLVPPDADFCRRTVEALAPLQERFRRELGVGFAYLADEFYLQAGLPLPPVEDYDEFPQIENGIGMARDFLDVLEGCLSERPPRIRYGAATFVTGRLFAPILEEALTRINARWGTDFRHLVVENSFLGPRVTVTGLLSGKDILAAAAGKVHGSFLGVPRECLSLSQGVFLDDMTLEDLSAQLGVPVCHLPAGPEGIRLAAVGKAPMTGVSGRKSV